MQSLLFIVKPGGNFQNHNSPNHRGGFSSRGIQMFYDMHNKSTVGVNCVHPYEVMC